MRKKNNGIIDHHWADKFNDWINCWALVELKNPSRSFTWVKNQDQPIMAKLDRILINTAFEQQYPLASVRSAPRASSDHTPLIIDFGLNVTQKPMPFRFEK